MRDFTGNPVFTDDNAYGTQDDGWVNVLSCPMCSDFYLHQVEVEVLHGDKEAVRVNAINGETEHVRFEKQQTITKGSGIVVTFRCESHWHQPVKLYIGQHKGCTFMGWVTD